MDFSDKMSLEEKSCTSCESDGEPLPSETVEELIQEVPNWKLTDKKIERRFSFKNFKEAMSFVNKVSEVAENEGHHPNFHIYWNKVILRLWTHAVSGLTKNDFIMAAKINQIN